MKLFEKSFPLVHISDCRVDGPIISDVVPIINARRGIDWIKPHTVNTQVIKIVNFRSNPTEITNTITIGIVETPRIDLIEHCLFPPILIGYYTCCI
jgi:hypothetical protein